jgi:DNA-binding MarR family transcriptional regulator
MGDPISRAIRTVGDAEFLGIPAVAFLPDKASAPTIVDLMAAYGYSLRIAEEEDAVMDLLSGDPAIGTLIVGASVARERIEALAARLPEMRSPAVDLTIIHLTENDAGLTARRSATQSLVLKSTSVHELGPTLDALRSSAALASAEVQRQVETIARAVIKLSRKFNALSRPVLESDLGLLPQTLSGGDASAVKNARSDIDALREIIRSRQLRDRYFPNARFGEPAWDILLDLALARFEGKSVSVSSACIASGVAMSTAMRWINEMVEDGLIVRFVDPTDARRSLVQLTSQTVAAVSHYLHAIDQNARRSDANSLPE